jgi:hypothetical protein
VLTIGKTLLAGGSGYTAAFIIDYNCTVNTTPVLVGTVTVASGQTESIGGIPTGAVCTVTETLPAAVAGYTWSTPVIVGSPTQAITTEGPRVVSVTNQLTAIVVPPPSGGVTPPPVGVAASTPAVPPTETPLPVNVVLPVTGVIPNAVNAGGGSSQSGSSAPPWGIILLLAGAFGVCVLAIRRQGSKSE